ncbi:MAG: efflux RND transporter periplasmic adaptor subunit [Bryobacteraceae bacterium]|nr:efflux RND transporter periplasmic adaptor subunit [Bryobacteraceae bacterium]
MKLSSTLLLLLALLSACGKKDAPVQAAAKPEPPLAIKTAAVDARPLNRTLQLTGSLVPDDTINAVFEIPGHINSIAVDFGQAVRKGQVLAQLDRAELTLQLDRAKSGLNQALARMGLDPNQVNVTPESTPAIRQAQAQMEDAFTKFDSAQKLYKSGDISQQRFTEMEKAFQARQAALQAQKDELRTQLASISALRADVGLVEKRLNDTVLRAPFDAIVSARAAAPGQYVKEGATILTLVKSYPLRLRVEVPESDIASAQIGTTLTFTTDAIPGSEFHAVVRQLNPTLDARSRTLVAEARPIENDARLRPGSFVQVKLSTRNPQIVNLVPKQAVYSIAGLNKVFAIRQGRAVELRFQPGAESEGLVEVPGTALKADDRVATSSLNMLYDGKTVQVN